MEAGPEQGQWRGREFRFCWSQQGFLAGWSRCEREVRDDSGLSLVSGLSHWNDRDAINLDGKGGEGAGLGGCQKLSLGCVKFEILLRDRPPLPTSPKTGEYNMQVIGS